MVLDLLYLDHAISSNTIELNQIFFAMINYVLSEQGFVDWIVKTSYIVSRRI
jgi:hypothetical protein